MPEPVEIAADIVAAGSAISGLLLVYMGSLSASFGAFEPQEKRAVIGSYQKRAWFAFVGLGLSLISVVLAIFGKWLAIKCMVVVSLFFLCIGLCWVLATAVLTVLEIR